MKYLFKEAKKCQPLLYGVYEECNKAINRYKNNARTNLRKTKSDELISQQIQSTVDAQTKIVRQQKIQRSIVDIALDKSVRLLKLFRDIEDTDSLQEEYTRFEQLLDQRNKLLTSDEIYDCYKNFIDVYIPPPIFNGFSQT